MKVKELIKYSFCLLLAVLLNFNLTACSDDDSNMPATDEDEDIDLVDTLPTEDIVVTSVNAQTAVFANNMGKMTELFLNRLKDESIIPDITKETQLIVLDETSARDFLQDNASFEKLRNYYNLGGMIYMDRPGLQQASIVARLMYGVYNTIPDNKLVNALYEAYIFRNDGAEKMVHDLYNPAPHPVLLMDSLGNIYTEIRSDETEPTQYLYGRFAERIARFVNECLSSKMKTRSMVSTLDNNPEFVEPPLIPQSQSFKIRLDFKKRYGDQKKSIEADAGIDAKFRTAYSFDADKDYYQIVLSEFFAGSQSWVGFNSEKHSIYRDKSAGASYGGLDVKAEFSDLTGNYNIHSIDGIIPQNEVHTGSKTTIKGWNINGEIGYNSGLTGTINGGYTSSTQITMPVSEMNCVYTQNSKSILSWTYKIKGPHFTSHRGRNGDYTSPAGLGTKDVYTEQAWNWIVSNTKDRGTDPFQLRLDLNFYLCHGYVTGGAGGNNAKNYKDTYSFGLLFNMPVPGRHKVTMTIVAEPADENSSSLRKILTENSTTFKYLSENLERCAPSPELLKTNMSKEWQEIYKEVKTLSLKGSNEPITFYLKYGSDGYLNFSEDSQYKGIRINTNGSVECVK